MLKISTVSLLTIFFSTNIFAANTMPEEVIVTASRFNETNPKIPANITVITKEEINNTPALNITDILATKAGVNVSSLYGRNGIDASVDIRGFGDSGLGNTLVLVDGQRINTVDSSSIQWASIPLQAISRIEIIKGSGSVLFGDRASGGIINIITEKAKENSFSASATVGSYGYKEANANLNGNSDNLYFNTFIKSAESNGWRDNTQFNNISMNGRGGLTLENGETFIDYSVYRVANGLPGSLINQGYDKPRNTRFPFNSQEKEGYRIRPGISLALTDTFQLEAETAFSREDANFDSPTYISDRRVETVSITPRIRWKHGLGTQNSETIAGFDYYHGRVGATNSAGPAQDAQQKSKAIYIQNSTELLDNLVLSVGIRSQNMKQNAHQDEAPFSPAVDGKSDRTRTIYDTGLSYTHESWSVYGKTGSTFRYANTDELFGYDPLTFAPIFSGNIKPQHGQTHEVGAKFKAGIMNGKISAYRMNLSDEIGYDSTLGQNINYDATRHQGVETELDWQLNNELKASLAYAYTDTEFQNGSHKGKELPSVPKNKASAQLNWISPIYGNYAALVNYTGKRYFSGDFDNVREQMSSYVTLDLRASWSIQKLKLSASALNLLDKRYAPYGLYVPPNTFAYYPADGRLLFLSVGYDFK